MFCKHCGKEVNPSKKFCSNCGNPIVATQTTQQNSTEPVRPPMPKQPWTLGRIVKTGLVVVVVGALILLKFGLAAINSVNSDAVDHNNNALSSFESGDSDQAINQLQQAVNSSVGNDTKVTTLKNLAYVYSTENKNDLALSTFQQALPLTTADSFDYYLISGEIAVLQNKPTTAYTNFNKAYQLDPNDFQVNNSLAIFHMNLDDSSTAYQDYPKALTYAQKANSVNPSVATRENLGIAYFLNENYDQSISLLSQSNLSQHPYAALWLGLAYASKKDVANAKYYFNYAINAGVTVPQEVRDYLNSN